MASVLWLGDSLRQPELLAPFLQLPVQRYVLPWEDDTAERTLCPDFDGEVSAVTRAGQKLFWHLPLCAPQELALLAPFDVYFLMAEDYTKAQTLMRAGGGRRLALGEATPPQGVEFCHTPQEKLYEALCRELPSLEPAAFYISGGQVRSSIENEDFAAVLERMRGR